MRPRQWFLSILLFLVSLAFLLFSHVFFSKLETPSNELALSSELEQCNVTLLANKDYYPYLKEHFRKAENKIVGTVFLFKTASFRDNEPADLLRELVAARKRNVAVEIIIDYANENKDYREANLQAAQMLKKAGVKVHFDRPEVATHSKAFVIDDRYCFLGSHNLTHAAMSMNTELSVFMDSPEIARKIDRFIHEIPVLSDPHLEEGKAP